MMVTKVRKVCEAYRVVLAILAVLEFKAILVRLEQREYKATLALSEILAEQGFLVLQAHKVIAVEPVTKDTLALPAYKEL